MWSSSPRLWYVFYLLVVFCIFLWGRPVVLTEVHTRLHLGFSQTPPASHRLHTYCRHLTPPFLPWFTATNPPIRSPFIYPRPWHSLFSVQQLVTHKQVLETQADHTSRSAQSPAGIQGSLDVDAKELRRAYRVLHNLLTHFPTLLAHYLSDLRLFLLLVTPALSSPASGPMLPREHAVPASF